MPLPSRINISNTNPRNSLKDLVCTTAALCACISAPYAAPTTPLGQTPAHSAAASRPTSLTAQALTTQTVATDLANPWAVAFLPDGRFLVTERPGRMRVVTADGQVGPPLQGTPAVVARGQGGLLDVALDSAFARNRQLYFCFSKAGDGSNAGKNSTAMARAKLSADATALEDVQVIFVQQPLYEGNLHFGCRIVERTVNGQSDGTLFLTLGERSHFKEEAQNLRSHLGKIVRVSKDGSIPKDNPLTGNANALHEIWSWGHRSPQGAALAPDGQLWMHEHGPQGGDEINVIQPGKNYGWPVITYGVNYGGGQIGAGITHQEGMEQPLHTWVPSIAPSGLAFVSSTNYGADWQGSIVVGALKAQRLERLHWKDGQLQVHEQLLPQLKQRVRDVRQAPDGWLYILTDSPQGQLLRLVPHTK